MFDVSTVSKRYFKVRIGQYELEVEPPKLKTMKRIMALAKQGKQGSMEELTEAVALILNKNKHETKVPETMIDELDIDQLNEILTAFFGWIGQQKNDPN